MKRSLILASLLFVASPALPASPEPAPDTGKPDLTWQNVISNTLARPGTLQPGGVYSVGVPRNDLKVVVRGIVLEPSFALTSYLDFRSAEKGAGIRLKGDLLLLSDEVNPVMSRLMKGAFEVTALHNHLLGESPRLMDLHFEAKGAAASLAGTLRDALALTGMRRYTSAAELLEEDLPRAEVRESFKQVQQILGQEGKVGRRVLQIQLQRKEPVRKGTMQAPPFPGTGVGINFQAAGPSDLAATGELVVAQEELMPVLQALRTGELEVLAIHDDMVGVEPDLKFIHFWGRGSPEKIATGLRAVLDLIALKR